MLFRIALHNRRSSPHFRHNTSSTPKVNRRTIVPFT
uniref:Uncharacterized protein n=1 Tax=Lepeophtheirus salmonis TaxID=72036 RepID=A0A0K2TFL7_LEPSM